MKVSIYGHSGSFNHGNEAIVRGISELLDNDQITLYSFNPEIDKKFELDKVCEIKPFFSTPSRYSFSHIVFNLYWLFSKNKKKLYKYKLKSFFKTIDGIYLLEAGDQYCEKDDVIRWLYAYINDGITKNGGKTIMLGCTINSEILQNKLVLEDLKKYSLIVARESITYNALIKAGITENTVLAPDPAFLMASEICPLPNIFKNDVVGINVGFLAQGNEKYYDLLVENCLQLIKYILSKTNFSIALIPHVNWCYDLSDRKTFDKILVSIAQTNRIEIINENSAPRQKYIMSKCRFMIALRTHVAIPSIASQVPTLVTGYKVKSSGIVNDIFPTEFKLLAHVGSLQGSDDYIKDFVWLQENENTIRDFMKEAIPSYILRAYKIRDYIYNLYNK